MPGFGWKKSKHPSSKRGERGRKRRRGRWADGDRVPHIPRAMTHERSREVHFGIGGRGAQNRSLVRGWGLSRTQTTLLNPGRQIEAAQNRESLAQEPRLKREARVGVRWKGPRKQAPKRPFSAAFFTGTETLVGFV